MLTVEKLAILLKFNWDEDLFGRGGSASEKALLVDIDWDKYTSLLQDLMLVTRKLVAKEYAQDVHGRLLAACADKETAQMLIGYASTL